MIYPCPKPKTVKRQPRGRTVLKGKAYSELLAYVYERDNRICHLCGEYVRPNDKSLDHLRTRGMGGGWRDDTPENTKLAHVICNGKRGSRRLENL